MGKIFERAEFYIGTGILAVITGLVFFAAVMRFLGSPIIWSIDLAQLLFIWLCFIGAARALRQRAHLGVDLLIRMLGMRQRLWVESAIAVLTLAFFAVLTYQGYMLTLLNLEREFGNSGLSYGWVTIAVPAGCIMLSISILVNLFDAWTSNGTRLVFSRTASDSHRSEL
ncbi:MAG: TRAP transporter small permease [Rhodobacteraceae bacterium]|nr:TRAP transporter small permease [Paracoccaceae bacterium]